jgi:predicted MFS family arabinose efflux permease
VQATGSAAALATVLGCALVPRLVLLPLGGVLADRIDVRRVAIAADVVRAVTQSFVGVILVSGSVHLAHIAIAQAIAGAASAAALPTAAALVAGTVEGHARQRANSLVAATRSASMLFGPALAGLLIFTAGPGWVFLFDAAAFATSAALLGVITVRHERSPRRSLRADLTQGWTEVRARDWYWTSLIAHAVWNLAGGVMLTLGPVIAIRDLGSEGIWIAVLQAGGIGLLIGSLLAGRVRLGRPVLVANLSLASYAIPLALFAFAAPAWLLVTSYGMSLTALGFLNPTWDTAVQQAVPSSVLARVMAYDWLVSLAAQPLGFALAPVAAAAWSPTVPLLIAAVLVAVACLGTVAVPGVRRLRTT